LNDGDCEAISDDFITVNRLAADHPDCNPVPPTNAYVLVGLDAIDMERNVVHSGGVGVVASYGDVEVSEDSYIVDGGTFVTAPNIDINRGSKVNYAHAVGAEPELPEFLYNGTPVGDDLEVQVGDNETIILTDEVYEDIKVSDGATVIFSGQGDVYIEDLTTDDDVTIIFEQCTNLIISGRIVLGRDNTFNPTSEDVFVFAAASAEVKRGSDVYGVIYTRGRFNVRKADSDNPTNMTGLFIGREVRSRDYVMFYQQSFEQCSTTFTGGGNNQASINEDNSSENEELLEAKKVGLTVFPNPASTVANVQFTKSLGEQGTLQIYNGFNQLVGTEQVITIGSDPLEIDLTDLPTGVYYLTVTPEHGDVLTQKLIVSESK